MGYSENGVTLLDRARAATHSLIDSLRSGDTVSIVLAAGRASGPDVLFPEPIADRAAVKQALDGIAVATLGTDLAAAVLRAESVAERGAAQSREVYLLSDLQDSGWDIRDDMQDGKKGSEVMFFFVPIRPARPDNVAIAAIQYAAARPMAGIPFAIRPHIVNQSEKAGACEIALYIDGEKTGERRLTHFQAGRWAAPLFHHTFARGGWHSGYVDIGADNFAPDNRRYFAVEVLDSIRILAVNGAPSQIPQRDALFFLRTALTTSAGNSQPIGLESVAPPELAGKDVTGYAVILLVNVESLPPAAVEKLEAFADQGGSLLVVLGERCNAAFYNQSLASAARLHGGLLPARLKAIQRAPEQKPDQVFIADVNYEHEALAPFHDPAFANLASVTFKAWWELEPGGGEAVLMRANTGAPLLCEKAFGQGRVMVTAMPCDREWSSFPVRPAFLPWLHRLIGYLAQEPGVSRRFYLTGQKVPVPVPALDNPPPVAVKKPDGSSGYAHAGDSPAEPLVFSDTSLPGIYSLIISGRDDHPPLIAVNLDGYESDLRYLDDVLADRGGALKLSTRAQRIQAGLHELLPGRPMVAYIETPAAIVEASAKARRGTKLWDDLLLLALAVALFEPWLANRISRQLAVGVRRNAGRK
jgi:hypothetical protein